MLHRLVLTSRWRLDTDATAVWQLLTDVERWPAWWRYLRRAKMITRAATSPIGDVCELHWRSALPYGVHLRMTTATAERPSLLEGHAEGDLRGVGAWILEPVDGRAVDVTYRWEVALEKPWMRWLAPLLTPIFTWNHFVVMRAGARGMATALGCRLSNLSEWAGGAWR